MLYLWIGFFWNFSYGYSNEIYVPFINNSINHRTSRQNILDLGICKILLNRECPNEEIKYYLYTRTHPQTPEELTIDKDLSSSNILQSSFKRRRPTKILIHGYNSGMLLNSLIEIKNQYLMRSDMNIFTIDWESIAQGPCYPAAVYNARIAGKCSALLVEMLRDLNVEKIHVIGFSLGAHVSGFLANTLQPYKLFRITGLDPAMPGFATVGNHEKLDSSDAEFVDVIHTNAFFQGQIRESGHVDFYMNGGVVQPGCWADDRFFACNHHRAPFYFAESINSELGFWGWPCPNYISYLANRCQPREPQIIVGEFVNRDSKGMHLAITDSVSPFAVGRFTGPTIDIFKDKLDKSRVTDFERYKQIMMMNDCSDNFGENTCKNNYGDGFGDNLLFGIFP